VAVQIGLDPVGPGKQIVRAFPRERSMQLREASPRRR
jgi:hypothetical protein